VEQGEPPEWLFLVLHSDLPAAALTPALVKAASEVLPDYPLYSFHTLTERLNRSIEPRVFNSLIFSFFAVISLLLVLLGIYGLISFAARQRAKEIAIRMALGGSQSSVLRLMVRQGLIPAILGIALGLLVALLLVGSLRSMLFGVQSTDPYVLVLVPLVLAVLAAAASFLPARRAARSDPGAELRRG
jgi:ABC-type antimicrobial peptide transport system permease subunit